MQLQLFSEEVSLTEEQKEYVRKKITLLEKYAHELFDASTCVRIDVRSNKVKSSNHHFSVQVTVFVHPSILRAEESGITVEEAIDLVEEKLKRQIERYKQKQHRRTHTGEWIPESTLEQLSTAQTEVPLTMSNISKRKRIADLEKIHEDEAVEQLELIDHDFYIFDSKDTGFISVVYKRKDGTYGIIEVEKWALKKW